MRQAKVWDAAAPATVTEEVSHTHWATGKGADRGATPASQAGRPASATTLTDGVCRGELGVTPHFAAFPLGRTMTARLHICTTCKAGLPVGEGEACEGARLYAALAALPAPDGVQVLPIECLSACNSGAAVCLSKPGAWGYVYGRLNAENAADILAGAAAYAKTNDGLVPWRERPTIFRKQSIARIPPLEA